MVKLKTCVSSVDTQTGRVTNISLPEPFRSAQQGPEPHQHLQLWVTASINLPVLLAEVLVDLILHHTGSTAGLQPWRGRRLHFRGGASEARGKQEQQISMPVKRQTQGRACLLSSHNLGCTDERLTLM